MQSILKSCRYLVRGLHYWRAISKVHCNQIPQINRKSSYFLSRRVLFPGTSTAHQIRIMLKVKCNLISLKYYPSFFFQKTTLYSMSWDLKNMSGAILTDMISGAKFDHFSKVKKSPVLARSFHIYE